jgi:hypothetical protein
VFPGNSIAVALVAILAGWLMYILVRNRAADSRFNCRPIGWRNREVRAMHLGREAVAPCEPGGHGELVVLESKLAWVDGQTLAPDDRKHLADTIEKWGRARGGAFHVITTL